MNHPEMYARIVAFTPEQREQLGCMTEMLVTIIENPHLPAMLVRVLPSAPEDEKEIVVAHCLSNNLDAAAEMLRAFSMMRELADAAAQLEAATQPRH